MIRVAQGEATEQRHKPNQGQPKVGKVAGAALVGAQA